MISISIISPLKSMAVIDKAIEHNDFGCVFHRYVYENLEEIKDIYEQCKDISDVLFFSGELGYSYILTHVDDLKVPCTFISYTEKTLLSILLNFDDHYPDVPLNRLYIDFLTPVNDFMNLKKYLDPEHMPYCFENPVYNYETLKERAVELWESKKIDMMFTRTTNQLGGPQQASDPLYPLSPHGGDGPRFHPARNKFYPLKAEEPAQQARDPHKACLSG